MPTKRKGKIKPRCADAAGHKRRGNPKVMKVWNRCKRSEKPTQGRGCDRMSAGLISHTPPHALKSLGGSTEWEVPLNGEGSLRVWKKETDSPGLPATWRH